MVGVTNSCTNALAAPVEPYTPDNRTVLQMEAIAGPRSSTAPTLASVNQAPGRCVGSMLSCRSGPPECHQARARTRSAATGVSLAIQPPAAPAPKPTPHCGCDHSSSPLPCAAAVQAPSLRLVPATTTPGPA